MKRLLITSISICKRILMYESRHTRSSAPSLGSPLVDEER